MNLDSCPLNTELLSSLRDMAHLGPHGRIIYFTSVSGNGRGIHRDVFQAMSLWRNLLRLAVLPRVEAETGLTLGCIPAEEHRGEELPAWGEPSALCGTFSIWGRECQNRHLWLLTWWKALSRKRIRKRWGGGWSLFLVHWVINRASQPWHHCHIWLDCSLSWELSCALWDDYLCLPAPLASDVYQLLLVGHLPLLPSHVVTTKTVPRCSISLCTDLYWLISASLVLGGSVTVILF